jgi:hypothetical protein
MAHNNNNNNNNNNNYLIDVHKPWESNTRPYKITVEKYKFIN